MVRADLENTVECAAGSTKATFVEQGKVISLRYGHLLYPNIWTCLSVKINVNNVIENP